MQSRARILFAGTPDFAVPTLQSIVSAGHDVVAVLTQPDRPAGRGRKLQPGPVKVAALAAQIDVLQPLSLGHTEIQDTLRDLQADLMVVVAYGLLLPPAVLQIPRLGCVNVHASLLPRWRGASPMQAAILAGDPETGVSIMQMDEGLDTGPVYQTASVTIGAHETAAELHDRLAEMGGKLLSQCLPDILAGQASPIPQPEDGVTYAGRIRKADGVIDWSCSAEAIDRLIRAYNSWPVAQTSLAGEQLRCWSAYPDPGPNDQQALPGTVLDSTAGITVQTGSGTIVLTEVQAPGRKRVRGSDFARAHDLTGVVLGH